jgi:hypothetical protein
LLVNVVFAALLGAVLATILASMSKRALYVTAGCIAVVALGVGVFALRQAAASQARSDEEFADEQLAQHYSDAAKFTLHNAARNWRLALRFDEATRVENRINKLAPPIQDWRNDPVVQAPPQAPKAPPASGNPFDQFDQAARDLWFVPDPAHQPAPTPKKYISTEPNAGQMPPATQGELPAITVNSGKLNLPIEIRLVCLQEGQDPFAWLSITRHNKEQERYFEPYRTKMVSMYRPVVKKLVDGTYEVTFTEERP